jgi:glycosyltransferase involved in cell wall biosynthesis
MKPFVSIIVPVRNEKTHIHRCLQSIVRQDYDRRFFEILVVDGASTDGTREIIQKFQRQHEHITLINNPRGIVPISLNLGLQRAKGDIVIRVDGHASITPNYISACVKVLRRTQADCAGGAIASVNEDRDGRAIALAMSSKFGVGNSHFRVADYEGYVDTLAFGAYKREVFERIGTFDEELVRCQDDEFNYRLRKNGGKLYLSPQIKSFYYPRSNLKKLWRQYFQYGVWKIRVLQMHPTVMQARQFAPVAFVLALLIPGLAAPFLALARWAFAGIVSLYSFGAVAHAFNLWRRTANCSFGVLLASFPTLHLSYGTGFLIGLIKFRKRWGEKPARARLAPIPAFVPEYTV